MACSLSTHPLFCLEFVEIAIQNINRGGIEKALTERGGWPSGAKKLVFAFLRKKEEEENDRRRKKKKPSVDRLHGKA